MALPFNKKQKTHAWIELPYIYISRVIEVLTMAGRCFYVKILRTPIFISQKVPSKLPCIGEERLNIIMFHKEIKGSIHQHIYMHYMTPQYMYN